MTPSRKPDAYTISRSRELVRRCIDDIAEVWPKGKPVDHGVAERFDAALVKAIGRRDVPAVETYCIRYRRWAMAMAGRRNA